ncbi:hypothetical protein [Lutispora thermophila]|uniref:Uncharacterized protein n=1 Tax=Lutispora thermophila DSM 19022 TaxID=1122184 RepID=A0A1M6H103_9FIRM|nr:hypothetical protein [Lutispora thermophila]SHJ15893.1 hypothetical protein SAMN02745176_02596 [Lutispora thermophila DSM 19022]
MSAHDRGPITQKPISEIAEYIKNLIPANIPENYAIKPRFESIAKEEIIRKGVVAFRDFLYLFCHRLISDGHLFVKPQKNPKSQMDYPFLHSITDLLADIGYYGKLSEDGQTLLVTELPSYTSSIDGKGNKKNPKNSSSMLLECLRFLTLCGFAFNGVDLEAKKVNISGIGLLEVSYPNDPVLLVGLKVMAIADVELRRKRYINDNNHDNLLCCDYRLIKEEDSDVLDVLRDFLHPLPEEVQKLALELHQRYIDMGMTCAVIKSVLDIHFAYADIKNSRKVLSTKDIYQKRAWEFSFTMRFGYCLVIKAKKVDKYSDVIKEFPSHLQQLIARGYGCDRKLRNEPCQCGCHGFRIPLDNSILNIGSSIETWLDNEIKK